MDDTLFKVELPDEYLKLGDRILETTTVVLVMHVLLHVTPTPASGLLGPSLWRALLFAFIGFFTYYLVVKKVVKFVPIQQTSSLVMPINFAEILSQPIELLQKLRSWLKEKL
jgi:hypothetical protein